MDPHGQEIAFKDIKVPEGKLFTHWIIVATPSHLSSTFILNVIFLSRLRSRVHSGLGTAGSRQLWQRRSNPQVLHHLWPSGGLQSICRVRFFLLVEKMAALVGIWWINPIGYIYIYIYIAG